MYFESETVSQTIKAFTEHKNSYYAYNHFKLRSKTGQIKRIG